MTLAQALKRILNRVGLADSTEEFKDRARDYVNQIMAETQPDPDWWFLNTETTFATVASTRVYQPVSGNVTAWHSFYDQTNNRSLSIVGPEEYDLTDIDRSDEGTVSRVFVGGADATTGYPTVALSLIPSSVVTIRCRYLQEIGEWSSSDDSSSLTTLGIPRIFESIIIYGASSLYMEENGDDSGAGREGSNFQRVLQTARKQNVTMQGNRRFIPPPSGGGRTGLITVGTDIVV
tara:strand:+ start:734 stop:1435 length:702 start_codon:yes stop_codon:yes gene_type:complete